MIIRHPHNKDNPYFMLNRSACDDPRLNMKAVGLHSYLMSKPDGWQINVAHIAKRFDCGQRMVRSALRELKEHGYTQVIDTRDPKGRILNRELQIFEVAQNHVAGGATEPSERPEPSAAPEPTSRKPTLAQSATVDNRHCGKAQDIVSNDLLENNETTESNEKAGLAAEPAALVADPAALVADPAALVADPAALVADPAALVADPAALVAEPAALAAENPPHDVGTDTASACPPAPDTITTDPPEDADILLKLAYQTCDRAVQHTAPLHATERATAHSLLQEHGFPFCRSLLPTLEQRNHAVIANSGSPIAAPIAYLTTLAQDKQNGAQSAPDYSIEPLTTTPPPPPTPRVPSVFSYMANTETERFTYTFHDQAQTVTITTHYDPHVAEKRLGRQFALALKLDPDYRHYALIFQKIS